ncbi:NITROGEN REGULATORY PROTEIN P-II-like protein [Salix koriyanagi]|uniref:NITROGEN REGULATORY PROTEIN P-II-like protein n=1 Tax=Salix koriyanagi TaxID=2511006 RepID=A0A9Q0TFE7_9ROSI|nr:NITROGEN REGULATORY PROTEIN P-II-like protein [Salix koriyanagi]
MASTVKPGSLTSLQFHYSPNKQLPSLLKPLKLKNYRFSQFSLTLNTARNASVIPTIRAQSSSVPEYVPDAKFYKVEAILRPWRVSHVSSALLKIGIRGVTVFDVRGFGAQGGSKERHAGSEFSEDNFIAKVKMEIVVRKDQVEAVIEKVKGEAWTGEIGDGKIFLVPVADVIRIRTGERGEKAERMAGGLSDMTFPA